MLRVVDVRPDIRVGTDETEQRGSLDAESNPLGLAEIVAVQ
jgi:hypothetical protein